jgi:DNA-directed RNA polymerase specialized sigma24 family protein
MEKGPELMDFLKKYENGEINKKELEGNIFNYVLENPQRFRLETWEREDCIDYLCWLYPRISRAIERYEEIGASFDAYINAIIRWSSKEYRVKNSDHMVMEYAYWQTNAIEKAVFSEEPDYTPPAVPPLKGVRNRRQTLMLLLKCYSFLSDEFIERAAGALRISPVTLKGMVESMRRLRVQRDEEISALKERLFCQYYRCILFEERMKAAPEKSARREQMQQSFVKAKKHLASMRKRLKKVRRSASNREIAQVLGIPKGTVDATIFAVKERQKWEWN